MEAGSNAEFVAQFEGDEARGFLEELVNGNELEGPGLGITKLVIDKGPGALSDKQAFVFEQSVSPHVTEACERCGSNVPWSEQYAAADNGGLCNYCWHMTTKDD